MGTIVVVHGAGVRKDGIIRLEQSIKDGIASIAVDRPGAAQLKALNVSMCEWGLDVGSKARNLELTIPQSVQTRAVTGPDRDELIEAARWSYLSGDPLFELRLAAGAGTPGQADVVVGAALPAQDAKSMVEAVATWQDLSLVRAGIHTGELAEAAAAVGRSQELGEAANAAGTAADRDFAELAARAIVADLIRRHAADAPGTSPPVTVSSAIRDELVTEIASRLVPQETRALGPITGAIKRFLLEKATALAADRLLAIHESQTGLIGDVLHYLRRGDLVVAAVEKSLADAEPPILAVGHSLGGIALVDLLSRAEHPRVDLLVTVGSQAPLLYAYNALAVPAPFAPESPPFTPWLNIYNRNDFASFIAGDIFREELGLELDIADVELHDPEAFPAAHSSYWYEERTYGFIADRIVAIPEFEV